MDANCVVRLFANNMHVPTDFATAKHPPPPTFRGLRGRASLMIYGARGARPSIFNICSMCSQVEQAAGGRTFSCEHRFAAHAVMNTKAVRDLHGYAYGTSWSVFLVPGTLW